MKKKYVCMFVFFLLLVGCSNEYSEKEDFTYSRLQSNFPIPANAKEKRGNATKDKSVYQKYELISIGKETTEDGEIHPTDYFEKIKEEGWNEEKNFEGKAYVFQKDKQQIYLELHTDYFELTKLE
ncbi:hypothetical protein [Niallia sp. 01092]|uniref:hypothetical protein n=1 Tax=unclassified Niallia TaxID=2837522 RepID=UPI003FD0864C